MDVERDARDESQWRYPNAFKRGSIVWELREAFVKGYIQGASRMVSDEEVEAAARALHNEDEVKIGHWNFCRYKEEHRRQARAALEAAKYHPPRSK